MGIPLVSRTFASFAEAADFVRLNPHLTSVRVTIGGVHVQDVYRMVRLLSEKEADEPGWRMNNLDTVCTDGRRFALFLEACGYIVDEAISSIQEDATITRKLGESLKTEGAKFAELVIANPIFHFFIGFAQFVVRVGSEAIEAAAALEADGEESSDEDDGEVSSDEDDDQGAEEAVQVNPPILAQLNDNLMVVRAALQRLLLIRLVFPWPEEIPVEYAELADFAETFPRDAELMDPPAAGVASQPQPDPEQMVHAAVPAAGVAFQPQPDPEQTVHAAVPAAGVAAQPQPDPEQTVHAAVPAAGVAAQPQPDAH